MAEEKAKKSSPAYVAYTTFKQSIRGLKHDGRIPDRIDNSVFGTMSGSSKNQLFGAMKFFALVDEKGLPSNELRTLALSDDGGWKALMRHMVEESYPDQIPVLKTGTPQTLKESFGDIGGIVTPAIRFLLDACKDVGIGVSPHILKNGPRSGGAGRRRKASVRTEEEVEKKPETVVAGPSSVAVALLDKFPAFDPNWKPEQQTAWFSAYEKLLAMNTRSNEKTAT